MAVGGLLPAGGAASRGCAGVATVRIRGDVAKEGAPRSAAEVPPLRIVFGKARRARGGRPGSVGHAIDVVIVGVNTFQYGAKRLR